MPFAQTGEDSKPIKRWSSWFDQSIVTQAGESLLADYDNWAIEVLRQKKLVWSGWNDETTLDSSDFAEIKGTGGYGIRRISEIDSDRLRLFFLSMLWRAAVSEMREFREVTIRASQIRKLRNMLKTGDPKPYHLFPFSLTQLTPKGAIHNQAPLRQRKKADPTSRNGRSIEIFRFYLDGLIAHFHLESDENEIRRLGDLLVGGSNSICVSVVPFDASWQRENLALLIDEAEKRWPNDLRRIPGFEA